MRTDEQVRMESQAHLLKECTLERVGVGGSRRNCYKLGDSGYCVKFYKPPEECVPGKMKKSIIADIAKRRFDRKRNSSAMEVDYYFSHWLKMPPEVTEKLLPHVELVEHPQWGYGILETYYTNPDGTAIIPFQNELRRQKDHMETKREIYRQVRNLLRVLIREAAYFFEPGNFHTLLRADGGVETKIVDFEPTAKTLIPLERWFPAFRRFKLRRKAIRYLRSMREDFGVDIEAETDIG